ncbi:heparinase II/III family protein [Psychromarinibacter sp. C21-152]|uniref:Heparinase II/III family protein n=1 Tax=Psychromarinibacter sediminicola TaxID=3033385 RepID=A0AAE3NSU6_9RHOB|nr:heparinase II/III family protein [Psychromarinibacter sediminicola]MDF0601819.1 heparinase II/III family protein [Psychromarinibacter sediminicola]
MNRWQARRATFARPAGGFVSQPEPRTIGRYARGKQLCAGNFLVAGRVVEAPGGSIWELGDFGPEFDDEIHGFTWLDDLAALGDHKARTLAQTWTREWLDRYGKGQGPGWIPDTTGRRLIRWINHAVFLTQGEGSALSQDYYRSLGQQTIFLSRRWKAARPGVPRFEALTGLIYAGLSLIGMERHVAAAERALARDCRDQVDDEGGIRTRNPEELLDVFTLLTWASHALTESGRHPAQAHLDAIARIAPTLRALRHSDGALARFHGGGRGLEGRLDAALAGAGIRGGPRPGLAMGFVRLQAARTSLIVDAAVPPAGRASTRAHASTLAFELTSGRRPLIVSCGDGRQFGPDWARAGRATASHSGLALEGYSSSRFGPTTPGETGREQLTDRPNSVKMQFGTAASRIALVAGHDGYVATHGLTHVRQIELSDDGRAVAGEDMLAAIEEDHQRLFDRAMDRTRLQGIAYQIRFHLHPDVDAEVDMGGAAVSMVLKSGEVWIFRHDGTAQMTLEPSVYLEKARIRPRATKQVVLSSRAIRYATRVRWTLAKAQETPTHMRDYERDESELMEPI